LQKSVGENFHYFKKKKKIWSRVTTVWLLVGFLRLTELTGPDGPAEENWPNCPAFRDFQQKFWIFIFSNLFGSHINPKNGPKLARSALKL
jgi:hypothetical protein